MPRASLLDLDSACALLRRLGHIHCEHAISVPAQQHNEASVRTATGTSDRADAVQHEETTKQLSGRGMIMIGMLVLHGHV